MVRLRLITIIQICIILIYLLLTFFSFAIQPIYLLLAIFCIFIIPGYNLLEIFKPHYTIIQKIGYISILSLAILNVFMFFSYLFLYDLTVSEANAGFFFNPLLLITSMQILSLILIVINEIIVLKSDRGNLFNNNNHEAHKSLLNFNLTIRKIDLKSLISYIVFFLSLAFLSISTYYSSVPDNTFWTAYSDYKSNFIFFSRVPFTFYIFLIIVIISLVYIVLFTKNKYIKLFSISLFIYTLWILPYLQIGNYFNHDSHLLYNLYNSYIDFGIIAQDNFSMTQNFFGTVFRHRYSTNLFTTILLVNATKLDISFVLWYIYPLIYISIPFFFYSTFKRYAKKKETTSKNSNLFILTIIAIISPQFIKFAHTAATGVIGTYVFLILVLEFYFFVKKKYLNKKDILLISFLFLFLCLTHTEEAIYFSILVFLYSIYQIFNIQKFDKSNGFFEEREFKKNIKRNIIILTSLILIFYLTQEFFGWINAYFFMIFPGENVVRDFILNVYSNTKLIFIINLQYSFTMSYLVIFLIFIGILILYFIVYLLISKYNNSIARLKIVGTNIFKFIHRNIVKVISKKEFLFLVPILMFSGLFIIDWFIFSFLNEDGILLFIELILSSLIFIINIIFFIQGIKYYRITKNDQNYYFIAILSCSVIFSIFFFIGNFYLGIYVLSFRVFSIYIFFNLIILENTYFKKIMKKNDFIKIALVVFLLFVGVFYSLRTLAYG